MKVTIEFDNHDEDEVLERIVAAASSRLAAEGRIAIREATADQLEQLAPVIAERARTLVDEALEDSAIGLPAMIMQRVSREIHHSLPARIDQLVKGAITDIAVEEAKRQQDERRRGFFRRRRN